MSYNLNDKAFASIVSLPAGRRYDYFVKTVAEMGTLWSLGADDGWVLTGDGEGRELVPVWPHPKFAAACAEGAWAGNEPREIGLSEWLDRWTPGMIRDQRLVAVFPTPEGKGTSVSPERLRDDLKTELQNYE